MTQDRPRNMAASVRQRLMNTAKEQKEAFDPVLLRYALERLLYRLSQSSHRDRFVLKDAMLFQTWSGQVHRPTRDLDFLGLASPSLSDFERIFREVCEQSVEDDGLQFQAESVHADRMKEDEEYEGLRLRFQANLASARIPIQIDIGFGDAVTPEPDEIAYPTLLDFPAPTLKAYPRETVVAEKFQAMVMLGIANSRMKDFYDVWTLARQFAFSGPELRKAIGATFERRKTVPPQSPPLALTTEFTEDQQKLTQWRAFLRKNKLDAEGMTLTEISEVLKPFLMPPAEALAVGRDFEMNWPPNGPWRANPKS
ncbi:MAG: nucleotidyl transferase AbiEii/AbiGii toxin family protein [Gammaproteobacteria bacterium]|nr:nucleotidyl transferase AbiEii/AbiGii toxin family protein [Gammaproteobacteria bacterium]